MRASDAVQQGMRRHGAQTLHQMVLAVQEERTYGQCRPHSCATCRPGCGCHPPSGGRLPPAPPHLGRRWVVAVGVFLGGGEWGRHALPPPAPPSPRRRRLASVRGAVSRVGRWWPPTAGVPSPRSAATRVLASPLRGAQDGRARARPHMEIVLGALCMLLVPLPSPRCRPAATAAPVASGAPPLWTRAQPPPTGGRRTLSTPTVAAAGAADDGRWGRRAQAVARCHAREGRDRCQARGP